MCKNIFDAMTDEMKKFLISGYFGDVNEKNLYEKCVSRAYLDLSRRIPYKYSVSKLAEMNKNEDQKEIADAFEKRKKGFKDTLIKNIIKYVKSNDNPISIIDETVRETGKWNDLWAENCRFGYGLCQKWVNMTLKYLWLFGKCSISEEKLDVPIDSYIIHAAMSEKNEDQPYGLSIHTDGLKIDTAWSKIDKELYERVQNDIKIAVKDMNMTKIQWENVAWIEQAKIEAQKDEVE